MARGEKLGELINLMLEMQVRNTGVSYCEIEEILGICRRSAQRNIQAIKVAFPQLEELTGTNGEVRWRLPRQLRIPIPEATAEDLASLDSAYKLFLTQSRIDEAETIKKIASIFRQQLKGDQLRRLDPDYESLAAADAIAATPGPKQPINAEVLGELKKAIKGYLEISIEYVKIHDKPPELIKLHPYGLLYGHRNYLVAKNPMRPDNKLRHYALPKIANITVLNSTFERRDGFEMQNYAENFFGVYGEAPQRIVWKFAPNAAQRAMDFEFHPRQKLTSKPDGSLIVEFHAGGLQEMAWHLMIWGKDVEVIEPQALRDLVKENQPNWDVLP